MKPEIQYLNTDLDLVGGYNLKELVTALELRGMYALSVHQQGESWAATLEADGCFGQAELHITATLAAIESLPPEIMRIWCACTVREFNLGYDCGDEPWAFTDHLSAATIARIAATGASFRLTLYPFRE